MPRGHDHEATRPDRSRERGAARQVRCLSAPGLVANEIESDVAALCPVVRATDNPPRCEPVLTCVKANGGIPDNLHAAVARDPYFAIEREEQAGSREAAPASGLAAGSIPGRQAGTPVPVSTGTGGGGGPGSKRAPIRLPVAFAGSEVLRGQAAGQVQPSSYRYTACGLAGSHRETWRMIMADAEAFENELQDLIHSHVTGGMDPRDIVDAMSRHVALLIDQNNLELEMELRSSKA